MNLCLRTAPGTGSFGHREPSRWPQGPATQPSPCPSPPTNRKPLFSVRPAVPCLLTVVSLLELTFLPAPHVLSSPTLLPNKQLSTNCIVLIHPSAVTSVLGLGGQRSRSLTRCHPSGKVASHPPAPPPRRPHWVYCISTRRFLDRIISR